MPLPVVSGQSLYDELIARLGGIGNSFDANEVMSFINDGMQAVWGELKNLERNYFFRFTQATDSTNLDTFFAALNTTTRRYTLPAPLREIRSISVLSPSGFEGVRFTRRDISSDEYLQAQQAATAQPAASYGEYFYDILDERTLAIAQFPEAAFVLEIGHIFALEELTLATSLTAILHPWQFKILDFAGRKAQLAKRNESMTELWRREWREAVIAISMSSGRDVTPQYVTGFMED